MAERNRGNFQYVPRDGVFLDFGGTDVARRRRVYAHRSSQPLSFLSIRLHNSQEQPTFSHNFSTHPASETAKNQLGCIFCTWSLTPTLAGGPCKDHKLYDS